MKILIDLDRTIFRTGKLIEEVNEILKAEGVDMKLWDSLHKIEELYSFKQHLADYNKHKEIDSEKIYKEYQALHTRENLLFPHAEEFLKTAKKTGRTILFTKGLDEFQGYKIETMGLRDQVDEVIIVPSPKDRHIEKLLTNGETTVFVEDKVDEIDRVKENHPDVITIRVRHEEELYSGDESRYADYEAGDLKQAEDVLTRIQRSFN